MRQLILGGARSGKSRLAETRAEAWAAERGAQQVYVATAAAGDAEMAQRIARHRERRGEIWQLEEEPEDLAGVIERYREHNACVLVDCLTLWVSNCLHAGTWDRQRARLLETVAGLEAQNSPLGLILVSNEVGSGIVPLGQLSRDFVDASGWLHQALAPLCERVSLVVAGLPLELKHAEKNVENDT